MLRLSLRLWAVKKRLYVNVDYHHSGHAWCLLCSVSDTIVLRWWVIEPITQYINNLHSIYHILWIMRSLNECRTRSPYNFFWIKFKGIHFITGVLVEKRISICIYAGGLQVTPICINSQLFICRLAMRLLVLTLTEYCVIPSIYSPYLNCREGVY